MELLNDFFLILNIILVVIMTLLSIDLFDGRRKALRKITKKGWVLIFLGLGIIVASGLQIMIGKKIEIRDEILQTRENFVRDSILKNQYDSSLLKMQSKSDTSNLILKYKFDSSLLVTQNIFEISNQEKIKIISETLGKYGYKFDSLNHELINYTSVSMNQNRRPFIRVSNFSKVPNAKDWSEFKDCDIGDYVSISLSFINTGPTLIKNARAYLSYENFINITQFDTTNILVLTAILRVDNVGDVITDNAYFVVKNSIYQTKLSFLGASWNEISSKAKELPIPFSQTGAELTSTGFAVENLSPSPKIYNQLTVTFSTTNL